MGGLYSFVGVFKIGGAASGGAMASGPAPATSNCPCSMSDDRHPANVAGKVMVPDRPRSSPAENKVSSEGAPSGEHPRAGHAEPPAPACSRGLSP